MMTTGRQRARCVPLILTLAAAAVLSGTLTTGSDAARPGDAHRFDTWVGYDVGRYPTSVDTADFNADGRPDAVWTRDDWWEPSISVTLNLGDGTLDNPRTYPTTSQSTDVETADLDGDGDTDIAVSARGDGHSNNVVDLFLNNGAGAFTHTTTSGGEGPESITAGDVEDDGDTDLVLANYNQYLDEDGDGDPEPSTISVLRNNGSAAFTERTVPVGRRVHDTVVADLTGDGNSDIAAVRKDEDTHGRYELHVLEQDQNGNFDPDTDPQLVDMQTNGGVGSPTLSQGDMDGDSDVDLVLSGGATFEHIVLLNDDTTPSTFAPTAYESWIMDTRLVDVDGDDDLDVLGVGGGGGIRGTLLLRRNTGDGTLGAPRELVTGNNPTGLETADLDGDGRLDVLVPSRDTSAGVTHLQGPDGFASPPTGQLFAPSVDIATGDLDADGDQDVAAAVVGDFTTGTTIDVLAGDGTGALTRVDRIPAGGANPRSIVAGDLDADDDLDLTWLVGSGLQQRVATSLGDGTSYADPSLREVSTCGENVTFGDADGDGDLDQVVGSDGYSDCGPDSEVSISLNSGAGQFPAAAERLVPTLWNTKQAHLADVDGDGVNDLVAVGTGQPGAQDVAVAIGTGDATFAAPTYVETGAQHREAVVADVDGDRDLDVVTNTHDQGTMVLLGDDTGAFPTVHRLGGEEVNGYRNAVGVAVGDIDGDAIADIAVANETGSNVGIHSGWGDGTFDERQVRYGMRPRVTDVALADLDGNGVLDVVSPAQLPSGARTAGQPAAARTAAATAAPAPRPGLTLLLGSQPACTVTGTAGADVLVGTRRTDVICGLGGNDELRGVRGGDVLRGGAGADELAGGEGVDILGGASGNDVLRGANGADLMRGAEGDDELVGGSGRDVVDLLDRTRGNDTGTGGFGRDHCRADRADTLTACD